MYRTLDEKGLVKEFVPLVLQAIRLYTIPFIVSLASDLKLGRFLASAFVVQRLLQNLALSDGLEIIS